MRIITFLFSTLILTGTVFATGVIDIAYSPYTITNPGSYIVVKDLTTAQNLNCITINTSDVTIDLNGHTLYGPGTTAGTGGDGIHSTVGDNITITNGEFRNFNGSGIYLAFAQAHISKIKAVGCSISGIEVDGGIIENNLVSGVSYCGILCSNNIYPGLITNNVVTYCNSISYSAIYGGNNCDITGNNLSNNRATGIFSFYGNCKISGNTVTGSYNFGIWEYGTNCTITQNIVTNTSNGSGIYCNNNGCNIIANTVANNSSFGIYTGAGSRIADNQVNNNGGDGIYTLGDGCKVMGNNVSSNNFYGIVVHQNGLVSGNDVSGTNGVGIYSTNGSHIVGNTVANNSTYGIYVNGLGCRITDNEAYNNTAAGVIANGISNTILNNSLYSSLTGLSITTSGNFFAGNILRSNTVETTIASGNTAGNGITGFTNAVIP